MTAMASLSRLLGAWTQSPLAPAGDEAQRLYSLWTLTLWICGGVYLLVLAFLGLALWRHRRRLAAAAPDPEPKNRGLELGLAGWAAFITVGLTVIAGASFLADRSLAANHPGDVLQVRVTGQQWWWRVQYRTPTGAWIETANEVHLPLNRPARIEVATTDVIHSFWIPNLSGKQDTIPGRINTLFATPRRTGWFRGQCAEFCGLQHAQMSLDVKVEPAAAFDAWLAGQAGASRPPPDPVALRGQQIVTTGTCAQCHTVRGAAAQGRAAPDLTHVASRRSLAAGTLPFNRGALMGWITQPQASKPGAEMPPSGLPPADALAVVHYLEGLT
jgi:cytochrome c oxidase subunit 2